MKYGRERGTVSQSPVQKAVLVMLLDWTIGRARGCSKLTTLILLTAAIRSPNGFPSSAPCRSPYQRETATGKRSTKAIRPLVRSKMFCGHRDVSNFEQHRRHRGGRVRGAWLAPTAKSGDAKSPDNAPRRSHPQLRRASASSSFGFKGFGKF